MIGMIWCVHPSVCPILCCSVQRVCCCGPSSWEISINIGGRQALSNTGAVANASSVVLRSEVRKSTQTFLSKKIWCCRWWFLCQVNTQLYSAREKAELLQLVRVMIAYNLTYQQTHAVDGQYNYCLEPYACIMFLYCCYLSGLYNTHTPI